MIEESEDLLSPNYDTLNILQRVRIDGCHCYLILISNVEQTSSLLRFGDFHREIDTRAFYILQHDYRLFKSDLHYLWKKIVNVVFIKKHVPVQSRGPWFEISTVPFPSPIRGILIPRRLEVWRKGKLQNDLFVKKTADLRGQELQIAAFPHIPATVKSYKIDNRIPADKTTVYGGTEIEILRALSVAMNFVPVLYEPANAEEEKWGRRIVNGSFTGLLGEISSGRADMLLGNLHYSPFYLRHMDLTVPYDAQCLTFITPESLKDISWQTLMLPFKPIMWAFILVTLILGGLVFHALACFHHHTATRSGTPTEGLGIFKEIEKSVLYTLGMLLLISLPKLPSGWSLRLLTGWWWLYCVLVVVAYRASMTAILANPTPRITIDTMDQLADNPRITCGGWGEQIKEFFLTSLDNAGQKIGEKMQVIYDSDNAMDRVARGDYAYYENIHFLRQVMHEEEQKIEMIMSSNESQAQVFFPLHIMRDCVINMPIAIGLQKNSPLKPRIDKFLQRVIEAGLVKKWLGDVMAAVKSPLKTETKALMDLRKMYIAIVALGVGYVLGWLALVAEVIHWRCFVQKRPHFDAYKKPVKVQWDHVK